MNDNFYADDYTADDEYLKSLNDYVKTLETPEIIALRKSLLDEAYKAGILPSPIYPEDKT